MHTTPSDRISFPSVCDAFRAFHLAALRQLACLDKVMPLYQFPRDRWVSIGESNAFRREQLLVSVRARAFGDISPPLSQSAELEKLRRVIAQNDEFSRHIDALVGSCAGQSSFPAVELYCFTVRKALERGQCEFDESCFIQDYQLLERKILANELLWIQTTAVKGAALPLIGEVQLTSALSLRRLTVEEVQDYLGRGLRLGHGDWGESEGHIFEASDIVLERRLSFAKVMGDVLDASMASQFEAMTSIEEEELFVALMRVVADGFVALGDQLRGESEPVFSFGTMVVRRSNPAIPPAISYRLEPHELRELLSLWGKLYQNAGSRKYLVRAIKRFSSSLFRGSLEDRVIDLAISGESLFLSGEGEKTELTFRLSHRAGAYLGDSSEAQLGIYRSFKAFYGLRSKIVHGAYDQSISNSELGKQHAIVASVTSHMREALKRAIREEPRAGTEKQLVATWDELLFQST